MTTTFASYTGITERDNIYAQLKTLAGGRVYRGMAVDQQAIKGADGRVKPHVVVAFGRPIPTSGDRGMGVDETKQPHLMAVSVSCIAADEDTAGRLAAKVTERLLAFLPNDTNATALKGAGGFSYDRTQNQDMPIRFEEIAAFETTINLSPN